MDQPRQPLTLADVAAILDMLGREPDPQAAFLVFDRVVQRVLGHKLLTVMRHVAATAEVERVYSSNPRAYPVGGRKQKPASVPRLPMSAGKWMRPIKWRCARGSKCRGYA